MRITRFAPSPTGLLHVGNAFSALTCEAWARRHHARLLLRIEDIDATRCREEYVRTIIEDLRWLGIEWHGDIRRQSEHLDDYHRALERLREMGVVYPCFCTRSAIRRELARMGAAPHPDDPAPPYPGICRHLSSAEREARLKTSQPAWRLDIAAARALAPRDLSWRDGDGRRHPVEPALGADVIVARRDVGVSYHLAVVVDDTIQGVTHVIRGEDLRPFAALHRLLQALLDLPETTFIHHPLVRDATGRRLAKRNTATTLAGLREAGVQPAELRQQLLETEDLVWRGMSPSRQGLASFANQRRVPCDSHK